MQLPDLSGFLSNLDAGALLDLIRLGIEHFKDFAADLGSVSFLDQTIPIINKTAAELIDFPKLATDFADAILLGLDNLEAAGTFTVQSVIDVVLDAASSVGGGSFLPSLNGAGTGGADAMVFNVNFDLAKSIALPINLGTEASALGLQLGAGGIVNVDLAGDFDLGFGIDLGGGLADAESFFLTPGQLSADLDVSSTLNAGLNIGFLQAGIVNGTVSLDTHLDVGLKDPNNDGRITLSELQGNAIASLIEFVPAPVADLDVNLPIEASVGGFTATANLHIADDNLFESINTPFTFDFTSPNLEDLLSFNNLSPASLIGLINQLGSQIQALAGSFDVDSIPLIGGGIEKILDFVNFVTDFTNRFFDISMLGSSVVDLDGLKSIAQNLTGDAGFSLTIDGTVVPLTLTKTTLTSLTSVDGLVDALNTAISTAGIAAKVQASNVNGQIKLTAIDPAIETFQIDIADAENSPLSTFLDGAQQSIKNFLFNTIQSFAAKVSELTGGLVERSSTRPPTCSPST